MTTTHTNAPSPGPTPARPRRGPLRALLDLFDSVWLGIALISVLFVYMSIGSAIPPFRQLRMFEMTEFEWFNWWPFTLMLALICVNMTVVTLRRIPLTTINLGVWMIHAGVILLCVSGAYYFATKLEGDTPVIRRQVTIQTADGAIATLPAIPGASTSVGPYSFEVVQIDPAWPILSGDDAGQEAFSVSVAINHPERQFIRQLLAGYPQYTEDILPGVGRVVNQTGERLLDGSLSMSLDYLPQDEFYLMHSRALYLREATPDGDRGEWTMRPMRGLPRYNDYVADPGADVWLSASDTPPPADPLSKVVPPAGDDDPLADTDIRVTGYVRYAVMEERWRPGGEGLNPAADIVVRSSTGVVRRFPLIAFGGTASTTPGGEVALAWINDESEFAAYAEPPQRRLTLEVPEAGVTVEADTSQTSGANPALPFTEIPGAEWAYRIRFFADDLGIAGGQDISVAVIELRDPAGETFTRWVSDDMAFIRDMPTNANDFHQALPTRGEIVARYEPGATRAPITIVAGPEGRESLRIIVNDGQSGGTRVIPAQVRSAVDIGRGLTIEIAEFSMSAVMEARPRIVPNRQRDRDAGEQLSMIQIEIDDGDHFHSYWLPYNHYIFPTNDFNYPGRFIFRPMVIDLHNGRLIEIAFGRERQPLPAPVVLDDFVLTTRVGGFTGEVSSIRDWTSEVRFLVDGAWTETKHVSTNAPASEGGLSFFQMSWDPPRPGGGPNDPGSAGLAYTGLGVGNRNGVYTMLFACTLSVVGMMYAFYVKPVLKRRRVRRVHEQVARERDAHGEAGAIPVDSSEAVSV
jgi:hypothetical protein